MPESDDVKLTTYSHGAGCGCKISPAVLRQIIGEHHAETDFSNLLVGSGTADDAAVFDLGNGRAIISTTDFFMPIVDDAFAFGAIASANALSDVYAMGGSPLMAVAILGWPIDKLPASLAANMLDGARSICAKAGIPLAGGHTIDSTEPIFGLAVTGEVATSNLKRNSTGNAGDLLFLTKPLGVGIVTTAAKRGLAEADDVQRAINQMCQLNSIGTQLGTLPEVTALTDVTGFGLLGHLIEMCEGAGLSAQLNFDRVPLIQGIDSYLDRFIYPDMTMRNFQAYGYKASTLNARQLFTLCDPQTSGGLLVAVRPDGVEQLLAVLSTNNISAHCIGEMTEQMEKVVELASA